MDNITLRKIKPTDKEYFARWWRDKELLKLTSGVLALISDQKIEAYFKKILTSTIDYHFIINKNKKIIGHLSLVKRQNNWYETQIIIGEKQYRSKGYGPRAIELLLKKAKKNRIAKIYLEVRPNNRRAIRAYERCGFQAAKVIKHPSNKQLTATLRMELK